MATTSLRTASVLAFERKLANSDGLMFAGNWADDHWRPISIQSKDIRGTISNRLKANVAQDNAKLDAEIQKPNLQRVEIAALPFNTDTLRLSFTLRVLGNVATPAACNDRNYLTALANVIDGYGEKHGFSVLARRYAENLANGRFLWRNRIGAEAIKVVVTQRLDQESANTWRFDSYQFDLRSFTTEGNGLDDLAEVIREGLCGRAYSFLSVDAYARIGSGQEVFPSQELVLDAKRGESTKSKYLYQVNGVAAMHSQKIGNALRTVDTWYPQAHELGPIAAEPYGSVTSRGTAYRQPSEKTDFYNLLDQWVLKDLEPSDEQQHYVMAILVRGGVFGEKAD